MLMFSTAGVPPFVGFWAKLQIIQALLGSGHCWRSPSWPSSTSVIGAFYYLRVVWLMYFEAPGESRRRGATGMRLVLGVNALAVLALGVLPRPAAGLCRAGHSGELSLTVRIAT